MIFILVEISKLPKSLETIKQRFREEGLTVRAWAIGQGFNPNQVYQVLAGRVAGTRGTSHAIAQRLGLKPIHLVSWFESGNSGEAK